MHDDIPQFTQARAATFRTLMLDTRAAEAVGLLTRHDIPSILLKGRVIASWLYVGEVRNYCDIDLLVDPAQRQQAMDVLATLGYRHHLAGADEAEYGSNETELISPAGVVIDLHHTLLGVDGSPERLWKVLSGRTAELRVGGQVVPVLDEDARTMHLALHAAQNGPADVKALADLERGLDQLPLSRWREAARIARELDAEPAFSAGLRVSALGCDMATALGLLPPTDVTLLLRTRSAPAEALQIQRFVELRTLGDRMHLIGRKLWPTTAYMHGTVPGARAGARALLAARLRRMVGLPTKFRVAFRSWSEARHAANTMTFDRVGENHL
jgi:hypothetical protein